MSTQPTPGTFRAASAILTAFEDNEIWASSTDHKQKLVAEIIDRETGTAELLAALKELDAIASLEFQHKRADNPRAVAALQASASAISKAEGRA